MTKLASAALALLALAATAGATVRVFVTASSAGYGLEDPAEHMTPTVSTVYANGWIDNGYDYLDSYGDPGPLRPGIYPPSDAPSGSADAPVAVPVGDWACIWLQFQGEPKGAQITGLQTAILESGVAWDPNEPVLPEGITTTYYLCNQSMVVPYEKRWSGTATPPDYPEWHNNPQMTTVVYEPYVTGLMNSVTSRPHILYDGAARVALLGAMEAPPDGRTYQVLITSMTYAYPPDPATLSSGYFQFLREPCVGDLNCDGLVDFADINPFVLYLSDEPAWQAAYPTCPAANGDIDGDGMYGQSSFGDINPFVTLMTQAPFACP